MEGSILEIVGAEVTGIMVPVSICMFLVVLLVHGINPHGSDDSPIQSAATLVYMEKSSDSTVQKFEGALLNALVFVLIITVVTFLLVLLYYYRCIRFLKGYMCASASLVLAYMGGSIFVLIIQTWSIPVDVISFSILLFNFTVVGVLSTFAAGMPIVITQFYMVLLGIFVAYWFTLLPEWTTWVLLVALAVYDLVAVLAPGGPLNLLVDLATRRGEEIPALIYESRPAVHANAPYLLSNNSNVAFPSERDQAFRRQVTSESSILPSVELQPQNSQMQSNVDMSKALTRLGESANLQDGIFSTFSRTLSLGQDDSISSEDRFDHELQTAPGTEASPSLQVTPTRETSNPNDISSEETTPLVNHTFQYDSSRDEFENVDVRAEGREERVTVSTSQGIKLGLGDFVFYSVLVGRAAMYDLMTVYACYLAIISGLGCTLGLLAVCKRALPALPISISLGVLFYLLARLLMEPLVVGLSTKLMMF